MIFDNMDKKQLIDEAISKNFNTETKEITASGKGASGSVYCIKIDTEPYKLALKFSEYPELIKKEYEMLKLLKEKTESKVPEPYFFYTKEKGAVLGMEFIDGVGGNDLPLLFRGGKKHLADSIIDNLLVIQRAKNDKFGPYDNAVFSSWQEYYRKFSEEICLFCTEKYSKGELDRIVLKAVDLSYKNFDKIFCEEIKTPTLIHGDYWMPNFIIDKASMELKAAVDPFNVMWADPEYELFALTVGKGKSLHLYENYKSKVKTSKHCDMKL